MYENKLKLKFIDKNKYIIGQIFIEQAETHLSFMPMGVKTAFGIMPYVKKLGLCGGSIMKSGLNLAEVLILAVLSLLIPKERFRYKLGYAVIMPHRIFGWIQMPFVLLYILFYRKKIEKFTSKNFNKIANAKLPKLSEYKDFEQGLKKRNANKVLLNKTKAQKIFQFDF